MVSLFKPKTKRDPKYLAWLRLQPCWGCRIPADVLPQMTVHHIGRRFMGLKCSDHITIPACPQCHDYFQHDILMRGLPHPNLDDAKKYHKRYLEETA